MVGYLQYWGLTHPLFTSKSCLLETQEEKGLLTALREKGGIFCIYGARQSGKEQLALSLQEALPPVMFEFFSVKLTSSHLRSHWLYQPLARYFAINERDPKTMMNKIIKNFEDMHLDGRKLIIFVENAALISNPTALEEVEALLRLGAEKKENCFSFLTLSEGPMPALLQSHALKEYIRFEKTLLPLNKEQLYRHTKNALASAGLPEQTFTDDGLFTVFERSEGYLYMAAAICEAALQDAARLNLRTINTQVILKSCHLLSKEFSNFSSLEPKQASEQHHKKDVSISLHKLFNL